MNRLNWGVCVIQGILGIAVFVLLSLLMSEDRKRVSVKMICGGIGLQFALAVLCLNVSWIRQLFLLGNQLVLAVERATTEGTSFVFGYLGGSPLPFAELYPGAGFVLAFKALPIILVMSALSSLFYYWRLLPLIIRGFAAVFQKLFGIGGPEAVAMSANIFVGMVEAPIFVRPYLEKMTRSELFTLMTCGMATVAGTVMVLYASILKETVPDILAHILIASLLSVPASLVIAKTMIPETRERTAGELALGPESANAMDAIANGTMQGVKLLINIVAMLIVLVALVSLLNIGIGFLPPVGGESLTLQKILGVLLAPLVWLLGVPWSEARLAAELMGTKTVLNEFLAYLELSRMGGSLSEKTKLIMTYALCGFANPGSLGIMLGGLGTMVPARRKEIVGLGLKSVVAGTLATSMTGAVVGIIGCL